MPELWPIAHSCSITSFKRFFFFSILLSIKLLFIFYYEVNKKEDTAPFAWRCTKRLKWIERGKTFEVFFFLQQLLKEQIFVLIYQNFWLMYLIFWLHSLSLGSVFSSVSTPKWVYIDCVVILSSLYESLLFWDI